MVSVIAPYRGHGATRKDDGPSGIDDLTKGSFRVEKKVLDFDF